MPRNKRTKASSALPREPVGLPTAKAEETRARILDAALALFERHGYDGTTMRMVAEEASVSLGSTYYYFASKEYLLLAFYDRLHAEHVAACEEVLDRETALGARLRGVLEAQLRVIEPFHRFAGLLFKTAADPHSPLNPFHDESAHVRASGEALFQRVLDGSRTKVPKDLASDLPRLLWTYGMGVVLFWLYDDSPGRRRTHRLVEHTVALVVRAIELAANPLLRSVRRSVKALLDDLRS
jgi:AcrR family transcriptional regulator